MFTRAFRKYLIPTTHSLIFLCSTEAALCQTASKLKEQDKASSLMTDYKECRKAAMGSLRVGKILPKQNHKKLKKALRLCRRKFPTVSYFNQCRKEALSAYRGNDYLPTALKECRNNFKDVQFDANSRQPLKVFGKAKFFAGIDMSSARPLIKSEEGGYELPNSGFNCTAINEYMNGRVEAEHLLFGNELKNFIPTKDQKYEELAETFKIEWPGKNQIAKHPNLGQLYANPKRASIISYLPAVACRYDLENKERFSTIKVYFFVDKRKKLAIPYFGIVFFEEGQQVSVQEIEEELLGPLTQNFSEDVIKAKSKSGVQLYSEFPIEAYDHEGDPKDLCAAPRKHNWVAAIGTHKNQKTASYLLVNHVKNLCRFGDRAASRFVRQLRKKS